MLNRFIRQPGMLQRFYLCFSICFSLAAVLGSDPLHAGGWTQKEGAYYAQVSFGTLQTRSEFGSMGNSVPVLSLDSTVQNSSFSDRSGYFYGELGVTSDLTLGVSASFKTLSQSFERRTAGITVFDPPAITTEDLNVSGLGDLRLFARTLLAQPLGGVLSIQLGVKLPTGNSGGSIPFSTGSTDVELSLQGGSGFALFSGYGYASVDIGYRARGGGFNNEVFYSIEAGVPLLSTEVSGAGITSIVTLKAAYSALLNGGNAANGSPAGRQTASVIGNQRLHRLNAGLSYFITPQLGISADAIGDIAGMNTVRGTTFLFGLFFKS